MQKLRANRDSVKPEVLELLEQRAAVQQWLARLDEQQGKVSEHVLARVRDDYQRRLQEALDALATHRRAIQEEVERATSRLVAAESEHRSALDELEEARLRNAIGELDDTVWSEREADLSEAVRSAEEHEVGAREETERLRNLLDQLDDREQETSAGDDSTTAFELEPAGESDDDADSDPPSPAAEASATPPHGDILRSADADDDSFLQDLDLSLAPPAGEPESAEVSWTPAASAEDDEGLTAPKPGLKCGECGYTNDLSAWFCGVCGADVG